LREITTFRVFSHSSDVGVYCVSLSVIYFVVERIIVSVELWYFSGRQIHCDWIGR